MKEVLSILLLEDDLPTIKFISKLRSSNFQFQVHAARDRASFVSALQGGSYDCVVIDYTVTDIDGLTALQLTMEFAHETPAIVYTGSVGEEKIVACMKAGAIDFILKSQTERLAPAIISAVNYRHIAEERRRAQIAASESNEKLQTIFQTIPDAVIISRLSDGSIIDVNAGFSEYFGFTKEEVLGKNAGTLHISEDADERKRFVQHLTRDGYLNNYEVHYLNRQKESFVGLISARIILLEGQQCVLAIIRDITERKHQEEAIRKSETLYRTIIQGSQDIFYRVDERGKIVMASPSIVPILGYDSMDEIIGFPIAMFWMHPEKRQLMVDHIKQDGKVTDYEVELKKKDGRPVYVSTSSTFVYDEKGKPGGIEGVIRDITKRKQAENALQTSEELYRKLISAIPDIIIRTDIEGNIIFINETGLPILGYTHIERILGKNVFSFIAQKDKARVEENAKKMFERFLGPQEYTLVADNGVSIECEVNGDVLRNIDGTPYGMVFIVRNVTERKKAAEELRDSEERYRRLVEFSPDAIFVLYEGTILYVNSSALTLLGAKDTSELIGKPMMEIVHLDYRDIVRQRISQSRRDGKIAPIAELKYLKLDGTTIDVNVTALSIVFEGKVSAQVIVRDITEQKKLREQLLQSQKMEAIGRLAGGVAHDFNNMIGVIMGYASLLEKQIPQSNPAYLKIQSIIKASERSANLTRQLLAFARKQIVAPVPLDINEELMSLQKMIGRMIGEDIQLKMYTQENVWTIKIDPTQIAQIVTNFATNARDAIENTGTVTVETCNVSIDSKTFNQGGDVPPGEYVSLIFTDTGKGMDDVIKKHIFEPFFTTKPKGAGTGLGLSTVFGIVKQNDGFIYVYSEVDHGTTFKLFFPRFYGEAESLDIKQEDVVLTGTETLLVVEDEEELLSFITDALELYGYTLVSTKSPLEAVGLCKNAGVRIDLLITDVVMPGMNGRELREQIVSLYPGVRTLFMSGYTANIVAHRGILDQDVNFLPKPFTPQLLAQKVREVLDKAL